MSDTDVLQTLENADEGTLMEMIERANLLLVQRREGRRNEVMEAAASELETAGISADEFAEFLRRRSRRKAPAARPKTPKGRYVNPANPSQAYELGRGRPPRWFTELEASGELPEPQSSDAG